MLHSIPITLFILALYYYWFAVADRYAIFLYNHLGATPFDAITTSRYWMAGLVASGAVMVLYSATIFAFSRFFRAFRAPAWQRVWLFCAPPLAIGIPLITMTQNAPTLPLSIALACVAVTLIGLALALLSASLAARRADELVWLALDGLGIAPVLLLLRALELPSQLRSVSATTALIAAFGSIIVGALWLGAMSVARARFNQLMPSARATPALPCTARKGRCACGASVLAAGAGWSYLALPLAHYLFATPAAFRYISASSNFFATNAVLQLATWLVAAGLALGATRVRQRKN